MSGLGAVNAQSLALKGSLTSTCLERTPFYLIRHGESEDNVNNIATGWSSTPLTDTGRAQARRTGRLLQDLFRVI